MHSTSLSALFKFRVFTKKVSGTYQLLPFVISGILIQTRLKGPIFQNQPPYIYTWSWMSFAFSSANSKLTREENPFECSLSNCFLSLNLLFFFFSFPKTPEAKTIVQESECD